MAQSINIATLRTLLLAQSGNTFVGVTYVGTMVPSRDFRKRGNPYANDNIQKVVRLSATFNHGYKKSVDYRLANGGVTVNTFTSAPLPWGQWSVFNKFIAHNGNEYVRFYIEDNTKVEVRYLRNGVEMNATELATFLPFVIHHSMFSDKQANAGLTTKQVHPINPRLDGIVKIRMNKTEYEIVENTKYANVM